MKVQLHSFPKYEQNDVVIRTVKELHVSEGV